MAFVERWDIWDTGPDRDGPTGMDYVPEFARGKLICTVAARLTGRPIAELYGETPYGEVLETIALHMAAQFTPPPDDDPVRPR